MKKELLKMILIAFILVSRISFAASDPMGTLIYDATDYIYIEPTKDITCTFAGPQSFVPKTYLFLALQAVTETSSAQFNSENFEYSTPEMGDFCEKLKPIMSTAGYIRVPIRVRHFQSYILNDVRDSADGNVVNKRCISHIWEDATIEYAGLSFVGFSDYNFGKVDLSLCQVNR